MRKKNKSSLWDALKSGPFATEKEGGPKLNPFVKALKYIIFSPLYLLFFILVVVCSIFTPFGAKPDDKQ